jgi:YbgC/YbaW family acyl-CoA thioester hydrolase
MPSSEHMIVRQIEFVDTDMAGIMHFSNYYRMMEAAETSFFRSLGLPLFEECDGRMIGWPRVRSRCDYHAPLRFNDVVEVHLFVKEIRTQALNFFFRFRKRRPDGTREAVARGELTTVCATLDPVTQAIVAVPLPQVVRERLEVAPKAAYRV